MKSAIQKFMEIKALGDIPQMMDYGMREEISFETRKQQIRRIHWIIIQCEEELNLGWGFSDREIEEIEGALMMGQLDDFIYG